MMYKTYRYNDMPVPVTGRSSAKRQNMSQEKRRAPAAEQEKRHAPAAETDKKEEHKEKHSEEHEKKRNTEPKGLLDNIETDDLILIAVVLVLLMDGCDDKLLLLAIAYIFCSEQLDI